MAQSTTTTANPGSIVVPLSAIIDQLQGKLSATDLNALLLAVVGQKKNEVRPGDLITADLINEMRVDIQDLKVQVALLQGSNGSTGNAVTITTLIPPGPLRVGDLLEIHGRNFGFMIGAHRVFFNSTRATIFVGGANGSNDSLLILQIPAVPGVTEAGTSVTLTVANQTTTDSRSITLRPEQLSQQGNVFISFKGVNPTIPTGGNAFTANYSLESQALLPASVTLSPTVSIGAWQDLLQLLDDAGGVIANKIIQLTPGQTKLFSVRISQIPNGTAVGTNYSLKVVANTSGAAGSQDGPRNFTVGTPSEQPDPNINLSLNVADPPIALNNNIIRVAPGNTATIQLKAELLVAGIYDLTVPVTAGTNWTAQLSQSPLFATGSPITVITTLTPQFLAFDVTPQAGASASEVTFTIQRRGETRKQTMSFTLQMES